MPCPDLGALRASLDAPDDAPAPARDHARTCATCRDVLAELQRNAELAAPAIAVTAPDAPPSAAAVEAALTRLEQRRSRLAAASAASAAATAVALAPPAEAAPAGPAPPAAAARSRRRGRPARWSARARGVAAALVAAVVLTGLVATPGGRAAASSFLAQFRSQRFQVVALDPSQATEVGGVLAGLVETGVFRADPTAKLDLAEPEQVRDLGEAGRLAGFPVQALDPSVVPAGVGDTPGRILVTRARDLRVTFDRDRALDYLRRHGRPDLQVPEHYDGTQLVVRVPAAVVQQYLGRDGGPRLLVGKAGTVGLDTDGGATLEELRDLALRLPGLPPEVVRQLRDIDDWRNTLPLPVPAGQVQWRDATVQGAEAVGFADPNGRLHALLWQRDGNIWGVAGVIGAKEAQVVADSLG
jgi:hypothetical protein